MSAHSTIAFLKAAVEALRGANDPSVIAGRAGVAAWLDGDGGTLEALGLTKGWQARRAKVEHDALIREFAAVHFPTETFNGRANPIHTRLADYSRWDWQREKSQRACPHEVGSERAFLWAIMRALAVANPTRNDTPLGADRLARILSRSEGTSGER